MTGSTSSSSRLVARWGRATLACAVAGALLLGPTGALAIQVGGNVTWGLNQGFSVNARVGDMDGLATTIGWYAELGPAFRYFDAFGVRFAFGSTFLVAGAPEVWLIQTGPARLPGWFVYIAMEVGAAFAFSPFYAFASTIGVGVGAVIPISSTVGIHVQANPAQMFILWDPIFDVFYEPGVALGIIAEL